MQGKPYFRYWGKAKPHDPLNASVATYHLLPFHSLDVGAVGYCLLEPSQPLCQRLSHQLGVSSEWLQSWFTFCLLLHDLGKFFRAFQNLAPDMSDKLVASDLRCIYTKRHDTLGYLLWKQMLGANVADLLQGIRPSVLSPWFEVVCGHHGQPPEQPSLATRNLESFLLDEDVEAAQLYFEDIARIWLPSMAPLEDIPSEAFKRVSWELAGLAVLSDWLGSNQAIFPYCNEPEGLDAYWRGKALPQARKALEFAQLNQRQVTDFHSIQQQFPFIESSTPLQRFAEEIPLGAHPQLFILEDVTGAGKTEAAMVLVHRLMAAGLASGVYVGLPTMATANAMYARMKTSYRALYVNAEFASLVLSHSARDLSEAFRESVVVPEQAVDSNYDKGELSASAYCNQWLADNRKKTLLADVGVGTIDQALLAVLPARFQSLRLFGLASKVLLVDEVHAYDPYMRQLLTTLLEAHGAHRGSAILLSATLPSGFKNELVNAYTKGVGSLNTTPCNSSAYPLVTHYAGGKLTSTAVATRASVRRTVQAFRIPNETEAYAVIRKVVQSGQCVCWIRNTVKDARTSWRFLSEQDWLGADQLTLFHSRYAMIDRQNIEQQVMNTFGKRSSGADRAGRVLIATQVVEQSLDLDFDVLITDVAPVDLLIQRAGRLQRHVRTASGDVTAESAVDGRRQPTLYILAPDPAEVSDENWLRSLLPGTQAVYPQVGQLWLSLHEVLRYDGFSMPDDSRRLIEGVYADESQADIPESLRALSNLAEGRQRGDSSMGVFNCLKLDAGYTRGGGGVHNHWDDEVHIPTRLTQDSVTIALARSTDAGLVPYAEHADRRTAWALSQLSISQADWRATAAATPSSVLSDINELKDRVSGLRWVEVVPLIGSMQGAYSPDIGWNYPTTVGNGRNIQNEES